VILGAHIPTESQGDSLFVENRVGRRPLCNQNVTRACGNSDEVFGASAPFTALCSTATTAGVSVRD
jgi:hypothetical protein